MQRLGRESDKQQVNQWKRQAQLTFTQCAYYPCSKGSQLRVQVDMGIPQRNRKYSISVQVS